MIRRKDEAANGIPAREMPHNLELERAVLAVLLDGRHATAMHKVRQQVQHPLAFYQRDHRIIYLACLELDDQGHRVDAQGCAELLSRYDFKAMLEKLRQQQLLLDADQLDGLGKDRLRTLWRRAGEEEAAGYEDSALAAIGGFAAVADLGSAYAPAAGLERNVTLLWDYHLKRRLIGRLQGLADKAYRTPESFGKLLDEGGQAILDLGRFTNVASVHGIERVVDETIDDIGKRHDAEEGVTTGVEGLDKRLMSLRPGGLYVLAARPGAGKTSLALNLVGNIAGREVDPPGVLFFSLEVDRVDLVKKLLSSISAIDFRTIESGAMESHQWEALNEAAARLKRWRLELMDVSDLTVHALRSTAKRRMLESGGGLKLIVLDYLQLLSGQRSDMSEYEKVSEISRVLKVLARELRVPVLALSQMSRDSEKGVSDQPREPRLSDLRGSGTIEQDADAVIFIHHERGKDSGDEDDICRRMKLIVAKNRFGPTGFTHMHFFPAKMQFIAAPKEEQYGGHGDGDGGPEPAPRRQRMDARPSGNEDLFQ